LHFSIITARGGEEKAADSCPLTFLDEGERGVKIDGVRQIGLAEARGIADHGGKMDDCINPGQGALHLRPVTNVITNEFKAGVGPNAEQGIAAMQKGIKHPDVVPIG